MCKMTIRQTSCLVKLLQPCWQVYSLQGGLVVNSVVCHLNPYDSMIHRFFFTLPLSIFNCILVSRMSMVLFKDIIVPRLLGVFCCLMASFFWEPPWLGVPGWDLKSVNKCFRVERPRIPHHNSYQTTEKERHSKNLQIKKYDIHVLGVGNLNQLLVFIPIYSNIISLSFV